MQVTCTAMTSPLKKRGIVCLLAASMLLSAAGPSQARRGGDDSRSEFYGIVEERPQQGRQGVWTIGGHSFQADSRTEIDEADGPLAVGSCAKVEIRNGRVHEIDSEPLRDCR